MRCELAASAVVALADGAEIDAGASVRHVERCLRCQAELAQHRKVRRALARSAQQPVPVPPDLVAEILAAVGAEASGGSWHRVLHRHRAAAVAAATCATAATAAGAIIVASRGRRPRLLGA